MVTPPPSYSKRRLCNGRPPSLQGKKGKSPSDDSRGNLVDREDDGRRVGRLKLVDIRALVEDDRAAVSQSECQGGPEIAARNIGSGIVVEAIHTVDIAGDGGEMNNSWPGRGETQQTGGIRIHDAYGDVFVIPIQMMSAKTVME